MGGNGDGWKWGRFPFPHPFPQACADVRRNDRKNG